LSVSLIDINRLRITKIREISRDSPTVKTFIFHDKLCSEAKPGQFVMVWIPGVDEVPMSLSAIGADGRSSITVAKVGKATEALHKRKTGDVLGIRGPYGNSFAPVSGSTMVVGGGTGLAPLAPLTEELAGRHARVAFIAGAKTQDEILFLDRMTTTLSRIDGRVVAVTEDGSHGIEGLATDVAAQLLEKERFDMLYTCGPEEMMYELFLLAERYETPMQASLERLMRCAIGICGSCVIGKFRVCRDGPVFSLNQLSEVRDEFGRFGRGSTGKRVRIPS
jgi:dihydroorotate dehydrogenase electron transfer subunit